MVTPYYPSEPHVLGWLRAFILPTDTVLDVGSGDGRYQDIGAADIKSLDIWPAANPDYLLNLERDDLPAKSFSVILLLDILEHLTKNRGKEILQQVMDRAQRAVIVLTPLKWLDNRESYEDPEGFYYQNNLVLHLSRWSLADFNEQWTRVWLPSTQDCFLGYWIKHE